MSSRIITLFTMTYKLTIVLLALNTVFYSYKKEYIQKENIKNIPVDQWPIVGSTTGTDSDKPCMIYFDNGFQPFRIRTTSNIMESIIFPRILDKTVYNGIFHIRTENINGGYRKGDLIKEDWRKNTSQYRMPVTFIQIKICPFSESKKFRFRLSDSKNVKQWKSAYYAPSIEIDFIEKFRFEIAKNNYLLVILDLMSSGIDETKVILEDCLPRFSREAHPNAVVIYILSNLDHLTVDSIINSPTETIILKAYSI